MVLTAVTDILFTEEPRTDALRDAAARAFDVAPEAVAVGPLLELTPPPDSQVVMQRQPEDMPGNFPTWYGLAVDGALVDRVPHALDAMVEGLGIAAISDADDDEDMTLHLPDGSGHIVHLVQGDDDAFRITPDMRRLIEEATRRAADSDEGSQHDPDVRLARKVIAG